MRLGAFLCLALLIGVSAPSAHGRSLPLRLAARRVLNEKPAVMPADPAAQTFSLPTGTQASAPSALLDMSPPDGWVPVPGALPLSNSTDADEDVMETRIIQGDVDYNNSLFPYAAYLEWDVGNGQFGTCSGSLVAPGWVLTAAHCLVFEGRTAEPAEVNIWILGKWHSVAALFVSEDYNDNTGDFIQAAHDVAMVQLQQPSDAPTVALPTADTPDLPPAGATVYAAGYGRDDSGQNSEVLRYTNLKVYESSECPPGFADNFCAGGTDGYTCNGDSGGPIVLPTENGDVQVGLTSWGPVDCTVPFAYYARVSDHLEQINAWMSGQSSNTGTTGTAIEQAAAALQNWWNSLFGSQGSS